MNNQETELKKGNMSEVSRAGSIIYRDLKPQSRTIHRLLLHLEKKGLTFVPRYLGLKDDHKEMLSFLEGDTIEDYPEKKDLPNRRVIVKQAARMLRAYHDATMDFKCEPEDIWFLSYELDLQKDVICHNDFAPYNVTFQDGLPVGIIDFDTACPAPRIWDVAYAVYRFVPLSREVYDPDTRTYRSYDRTQDCAQRRDLLGAFLAAYGAFTASAVLDNVILRLQALVNLFDEESLKGNLAFIKMKQEGHQQFYREEIEFIKENRKEWCSAK